MTVAELIRLLKTEDQTRMVVLAKDAEGNAFSPLLEYSKSSYLPESEYAGEVYNDDESPAESKPAIVLWPRN